MHTFPFSAFQYKRIDPETARKEYTHLKEEIASATGSALVAGVERWNALRTSNSTMRELNKVWYTQDTSQQDIKDEKAFLDDSEPLFKEWDNDIRRVLLAHPDRQAIAEKFGQRFLDLIAIEVETFSPAIADDLREESQLETTYTDLTSSAKIPFRGEDYNLSTLEKFFSEADRTTRHDALLAKDHFYKENGATLDKIYGDLLQVRTRKAKALGHKSYTPLAYELMARTDYGPKEIAAFREEIRRHIVPIVTRWHERQAKDLGVDKLMFWDESVLDKKGAPKPIGSPSFIITQAAKMYSELSSETGDFFTMMLERGLYDLEARENKAPGGYCTTLTDFKAPFIFSNFNGTLGDITVLTHECGHAFNDYFSLYPHIPEYHWPTMDVCEIHSMALEFLTWPWMELFFGEEANRFRRQHLLEYLFFLPYACTIDAFQHEVYEHPSWSPKERHACWNALEKQYTPWRDYGDLSYFASGGLWQAKLHIFLYPFYYIDYALALTCALQLWMRAQTGHREEAMKDYLALCRPGGSLSFLEMLKVGNLKNPFEPGVLAEVAAFAEKVLKAGEVQ